MRTSKQPVKQPPDDQVTTPITENISGRRNKIELKEIFTGISF